MKFLQTLKKDNSGDQRGRKLQVCTLAENEGLDTKMTFISIDVALLSHSHQTINEAMSWHKQMFSIKVCV